MASTDTSDQTRPEKLEHPDFWARQRARMRNPAELRASAQRLGYWRSPQSRRCRMSCRSLMPTGSWPPSS